MKRIIVDEYVIATLMPDLVGHDRAPSAFLVFLALWARTRGRRGHSVAASHAALSEDTGLSKSAVQMGVRRLLARKLIAVERDSATATPRYSVLRPWRRR
jgi:hypothetical protein